METISFLGIKIHKIDHEQAKAVANQFLHSSAQHTIFTPNPEMLVKAQKDEYFKKVLNTGDLNLCDGMGVQIFTGIKRVPGVDFMIDLCALADKVDKGIYLLGSGDEIVIKNTFEALHKKFPNLKISGYNKGPVLNEDALQQFDTYIIDEINKTGAEILFVAFGMGKQEKWIYENLTKMPNIKVSMGVGGAFDFISGHIKRAPLFLRKLGLEWVYRLWQQPARIGRIFNATAVFTWFVIQKNMEKISEFIGWAGVLSILCAYALLSFGVLDAVSLLYQVLNIVGALGVVYSSFYKKNFQPVVLNIMWALIGVVSIIKMIK